MSCKKIYCFNFNLYSENCYFFKNAFFYVHFNSFFNADFLKIYPLFSNSRESYGKNFIFRNKIHSSINITTAVLLLLFFVFLAAFNRSVETLFLFVSFSFQIFNPDESMQAKRSVRSLRTNKN